MTTYNTGKPIGSSDPRDLYDNAENLDVLTVSKEKTAHDDRLGVSRMTWHGIEQAFQDFLLASGYEDIGDYTAGLEITARNQIFLRNGEYYRAGASLVLPYATTGDWATEGGSFVSVGDAALRQALADPAQGGELVSVNTQAGGNQTLRDALNARAIKSDNVLIASVFTGFIDSISADNTQAAIDLLASAQDGDTIDFGGKMWRIYDGIEGIVSATATPATDEAVPLASVPRLVGKKNITFRNGGLYAANQGTALEKCYYPSTLFLWNFESRGESYGDADASKPLPVDDRQEFLAVNGGHAVVLVRCKNIYGSPTTRLCGSTGPFYASSCANVRLNNAFGNCASLGYAPYCFDSWCGSAAVTGFDSHDSYLDDCYANAETLLRREDGQQVGSSIYCGKNGALNEDPDVITFVTGGTYRDFYGNSGNEGFQQGAAFQSGSSHMEVKGAYIDNCAFAGATAVSSDYPGTIRLTDVTGTVGLAVFYQYKRSFSYQVAEAVNCKIHVDGSRTLGELSETAYVINNVQNTRVDVNLIDCQLTGAKQVFWKPNKAIAVSYGGIEIMGGTYETKGYFCNVSGWGGGGSNTRKGISVRGGAKIYDTSGQTDDYIIATNTGGGVTTYIWFDLGECEIQTLAPRNIGGIVPTGSTNLRERIRYPRTLNNAYRIGGAGLNIPRISKASVISREGSAGAFTVLKVATFDRYAITFPALIVGKEGQIIGIASESSPAAFNLASNRVEHVVFARGSLTEGVEFEVGIPYPLTC